MGQDRRFWLLLSFTDLPPLRETCPFQRKAAKFAKNRKPKRCARWDSGTWDKTVSAFAFLCGLSGFA